jgi:mRNA interferase MazF
VKRGDVVIATGPGFGTKPRPFVVIQADDYAALTTLVMLPITTDLADPPSRLRVALVPDEGNGLRKSSEVTADLPVTARVNKVHQHIGSLAREDMLRVEQALALLLGFAG